MSQTKSQTKNSSTSAPVNRAGTARSGLAGFDFQADNRRFMAEHAAGATREARNQARAYGVSIVPADVAPEQVHWQVIGVRHLTGPENRRRHNAYIETLDEHGNRVQNPNLRIGWTWENKTDGPAEPKRLDKPTNEPATDIPLEKSMTVTLWLEGDGPSDQVQGLHTRHPDEDEGNTIGHHSYYIVFQRGRKQSVPDDLLNLDPVDADDTKGIDGNVDGANGTSSNNGHSSDNSGNGQTGSPGGAQRLGRGRLKMGQRRTLRAKEKIGIDANAPILPDGQIAARVIDPAIIADTGVGWVRLNFIRGPWRGPHDTTRHHGRTWLEAYRQIVAGLRGRGLQIYGLVGHEIVHDAPGDQFRHRVEGPLSNEWIGQYTETFAQVAELFHEDVAFFETFNEPDDWHDPHEQWKRNWIHPTWLAVMLQAIHDRVQAKPQLRDIRIISGPVEGFDVNDNAGVGYLEQVYHFGKERLGWDSAGKPIPFDGIGYHLYIAEGERSNVGSALRQKYQNYMSQMRGLIQREDPGKPIFVSEIGWRNDGGLEHLQQEALVATVDAITEDDGVALGFWFCTQDFPGKPYGIYQEHGLSPTHRNRCYGELQQQCARTVNGATVTTTAAAPKETSDKEVIQPVGAPQLDHATYVQESDRIKDYTVFDAGAPFEQQWSMTNSGSTTWGPGYQLRHVDGFRLGAPLAVPVPACAPGQRVAIPVPFVAPHEPGSYMSTWQLANAGGQPFGQRVWTVISVSVEEGFVEMPGAAPRGMEREPTGRGAEQTLSRSPQPMSPIPGRPLAEADPELYAAWRDHMRRGFENNQTMFEQVLAGFMNPYWTTVWMYRILFGVGVAAFVVAAVMAYSGLGATTTAIFGGLSVVSFVGYFLSRPLQALEENLQFITWLGVIYNSYWTRLAYTSDLETVQAELEDATNDTIRKINQLMDKHTERNADRPIIGR